MTNTPDSVAVTPSSALVAWPRVAAISSMVAFSLPTFITGIEIAEGTTVDTGLKALLISSLLLTIIGGLMGVVGAKTRMSSYVLVKIAFGTKGAAIVNVAFAISLVGWFGVNIDIFANAVQVLIQKQIGLLIDTVYIEISAGLCMVVTTIFGFRAINILASVFTPIIALTTFALLLSASDTFSLSDYLNQERIGTLSLSQSVGAIVGAIIVGAIILPDITRFCRHWSGGFYTAICAFMIVQLFVLFVAAFAAASFQSNDILELLLKAGLGLMAFFIVIAGSWILNSLNLYSTMLSLEATYPAINNKWGTLCIGLLGVLAAFFNILDAFILFLIVLVTLFIPVCGIILADYFIVRPASYDSKELANSANNKSVSVPALVAWLFASSYASLIELSTNIDSISPIASIDTILLAAICYVVCFKISKRGE